jgi:UDP-hydrolysing UDP-N-acetyl-D-glucosamine 2-epimerase
MRIAIVVTARPSYAKVQTVIGALLKRGAEVHLLACASALLERYGRVVDVMRKDWPDVPIEECWTTIEGANLVTSARETGLLLVELSGTLRRLQFSDVVVIADRHEVLAAAQAAAYLHLRLHHVQGGERTGSIDDSIRDAVTQLSDVHLVATRRAAFRVYGLTGSDQITVTGCPSIDIAKAARDTEPVTAQELGGAGEPIDLSKPFVVVLQHPVTDEMADAAHQMQVTLDAVREHQLPALVLWPGQDAGHDAMAKVIRMTDGIHTVRNLPPARFLKLLTQCSALVGNSSAGIREASYLGTPVINIGSRQTGRERGPNVRDVPSGDPLATIRAIYDQVTHGPFKSSCLYGKGDAGERIAEVLCARES